MRELDTRSRSRRPALRTEGRPARRALRLGAALALGVLAAAGAGAATFTVNTASVLGDQVPGDGICATGVFVPLPGVGTVPECTLRAALDEANAQTGLDRIVFHAAIFVDAEGGVRIPLTAPLVISDPVLLNGYSAPGYDGADPDAAPVVHLVGTSAPADVGAIEVTSGGAGTTIRGLAIHGFPGTGIFIAAQDVTVQGCHVGLRDGAVVDGNDGSGIALQAGPASDATIGQEFHPALGFVGRGNVVVASGGNGIMAGGGGHRIVGNVIGLAPSGDAAQLGGVPTGNLRGVDLNYDSSTGQGSFLGVAAATSDGVEHVSGNVISGNALGVRLMGRGHEVVGNLVGTSLAGDGGQGGLGNAGVGIELFDASGDNLVAGNVVSGNGGLGLSFSYGSGQNTIEDNRIGLTADGSSVLPNGGDGIHADDTTSGNVFHGNWIGGNEGDGMELVSGHNVVTGNFVGTNPDGADLGNGGYGIAVWGLFNRVGGSAPGEGNVVGFNQTGIGVLADGELNDILGNHVGTNPAGADLGNTSHGISLGSNNAGGGAEPGAGNVIGFNLDGIHVVGDLNRIVGNWIGTNGDGAELGNRGDGVELRAFPLTGASAVGNVVGSAHATPDAEVAGRGNVIAFNAEQGVELGATLAPVRRNALRGNQVFANDALGIDLFPLGPNPNDPGDLDGGTNDLQNAPELDPEGVRWKAANRTLEPRFRVQALNGPFPLVIDFYVADPDGEEGSVWLGSHTYTAEDASDYVEVALVTPDDVPVASGQIVATATDASGVGNTSEYSAPVPLRVVRPRCGLGIELAFAVPALRSLRGLRRRGRR